MQALHASRWSEMRSRSKTEPSGSFHASHRPDVEIPIQVKILVTSHARHRLRFPPDVTGNFGQGRPRVHHREAALEPVDGCHRIEQFIADQIDQVRVAIEYQ